MSLDRAGLPRALDGVTILLVEDDHDTRESFMLVLEEQGARVLAVASAAAALIELERELPDVLVSDIGMPVRDGYALMREIRLREASTGRHMPAIALTAHVRAEDHVRSLHAGFDAHVDKPIEPETFSGIIQSLVQRRPASPAIR